MPITTEQRIARKDFLGASDVPALFDLNPWKSAYDLWLEKTGQLVDEPKVSDAASAGNYFEPGVLQWAEQEGGLGALERTRDGKLITPEFYFDIPPMVAHPDAIVVETNEPVDAKTSGLYGVDLNEEWGDPGTDEVPTYVVLQVHAQLLCMGRSIRVAHVPAFLGRGRGFVLYRIERNEAICATIVKHAHHFWTFNVREGNPPSAPASLDTLKLVRRQPEKTVEINPDLVDAWQLAKLEAATWASRERMAKAELIAALGDAECGDAGVAGSITYFEQRSSPRVDLAKLKTDGLYEKYCIQGRHRTLRFRKPKPGGST